MRGVPGRPRVVKNAKAVRKVAIGIALGCVGLPLCATVAVAISSEGHTGTSARHRSVTGRHIDNPSRFASDSPSDGSEKWVSTHDRVLAHEALPCTGAKEPMNFEVFSAGPSVAGVPLSGFQRRCANSAPADEAPANLTNYIYGHCEIAAGATGCEPPLEIQTWPACQRALGDYSFEGKPLPYRQLPSRGGAEVVEINFMLDERIEVYTKSVTVVIFAENTALAKTALASLQSQEEGKPAATQADELRGVPEEGLGPPSENAIKGDLTCQP